MRQLFVKISEIPKTEASFNILDASFGRLENTHSDILAKLLEPRWELVNPLLEMIGLSAVSLTAQVFREKHRIDILIKDGKRAIIIENKLSACDQPQQLKLYFEKIEKTYEKIEVVYLTPYGHPPSDDSKGDIEKVELLSYEQHILPWLANAKSKDVHLQNAVKLYEEQVRNTINRNKYMSEIFEACFADEKSAQTTIDIIKAVSGKHLLTIPQIRTIIKTRLSEYIDVDVDDWESGGEDGDYIKITDDGIDIGNITLYDDYITIEKICNGAPIQFEQFDTNNITDERIQALICNDELLDRYMSEWKYEMKKTLNGVL